ncbi:hypothetical protein EsH8_IV_000087 [Colletotrichum jinshuiense]
MDGLLRTLTGSRSAPTPGSRGGGRSRNRHGENDKGGGNHHSQMEIILETLARGLVEYAVRKYMNKHNGGGDGGARHLDDRRISSRGNHGDEERARGGVPNMDTEMLEHLGRNILSKAMERFGGGGDGGEEHDERDEMRARGRARGHSRDRYAHSRERSQDRSHRRGHGGGKDEDREHRSHRGHDDGHSGGRRSDSPSRHHRDDNYHRRRRHGTDYAPLVDSLESLSNTIISLNTRQPGHPDCEFYDAFVERSGKVQESIGAVLTQIREREERREERRGRRRS